MESYDGYVETALDALILFEATRTALLPKITHRLSEKERAQIHSGSVFVWDEDETSIQRWTDSRHWSSSRPCGNFILYDELKSPAKAARNARSTPLIPESTCSVAETLTTSTPASVTVTSNASSLTDAKKQPSSITQENRDEQGKKGSTQWIGLTKRALSINTSDGHRLHLVSYYHTADVESEKLRLPRMDERFNSIHIPRGLYPEMVRETDPDGREIWRFEAAQGRGHAWAASTRLLPAIAPRVREVRVSNGKDFLEQTRSPMSLVTKRTTQSLPLAKPPPSLSITPLVLKSPPATPPHSADSHNSSQIWPTKPTVRTSSPQSLMIDYPSEHVRHPSLSSPNKHQYPLRPSITPPVFMPPINEAHAPSLSPALSSQHHLQRRSKDDQPSFSSCKDSGSSSYSTPALLSPPPVSSPPATTLCETAGCSTCQPLPTPFKSRLPQPTTITQPMDSPIATTLHSLPTSNNFCARSNATLYQPMTAMVPASSDDWACSSSQPPTPIRPLDMTLHQREFPPITTADHHRPVVEGAIEQVDESQSAPYNRNRSYESRRSHPYSRTSPSYRNRYPSLGQLQTQQHHHPYKRTHSPTHLPSLQSLSLDKITIHHSSGPVDSYSHYRRTYKPSPPHYHFWGEI